MHAKVLVECRVAQYLQHHFFSVQHLHDEFFVLGDRDLLRLEILLHIGSAMQASSATQLIGALLKFTRSNDDAVLCRNVLSVSQWRLMGLFQRARQPVPDETLAT